MIRPAWTEGNRLRLLENGEDFFPFVIQQIADAREEVLIETFILFEDAVGRELQAALIAAAQRGVRVQLVVDGYGSFHLSPDFSAALTKAGAAFSMFDRRPTVLSFRINLFRRLHRKTVVVDRHFAIIGGINFSEEHLRSYGPLSKQDYAVAVEGPAVQNIRDYFVACHAPVLPAWRPWRGWSLRRRRTPDPRRSDAAGGAMLVVRDNGDHRDDIEHMYRLGIRAATRRVLIANAYFLPGYRLTRDLCNAARRGVQVDLILQGRPDRPIVRLATMLLHDLLLGAGVRIFEYRERPLHAKVAVIDDAWSTVGSSNLDPVSLYLNLESNVVMRDAAFAATLADNLQALIRHHCEAVVPRFAAGLTWMRRLFAPALFHVLRHLPRLLTSPRPSPSGVARIPPSVAGPRGLEEG